MVKCLFVNNFGHGFVLGFPDFGVLMVQSKLQAELKKTRPFESPEEELTLNILRTADRINHRVSRLFREYSLTSSQYNILRILRGEGAPLPILEIASRTVTVVPGITGLVDRLEAAGLVERKRCTVDRRVIYVGISQAGMAKLSTIDKPLAALNKKLFTKLDREEIARLNILLEKAREMAD